MIRRTLPVVALAALSGFALMGLSACGSAEAPAVADPSNGSDSTIGGIGAAPPATGSASTVPLVAGTFPSGESVPVPDQLVGERVLGNKVLLIGDSLFAGLATRYGGEACRVLEPLGWQVAVEAETGRFIDFGDRVLDARLDEGWDAVVIMLGTNYGGDEIGYEAALAELLDRLAPRPTIVLTTTVFREMQNEVNAAIGRQVLARENVDALDWSTISAAPGVISGDRIHATDAGRELMAGMIGSMLGPAPVQPGDCLSTQFSNDSSVSGAPGGPGGISTVPNTSSGGSSGTTSTIGGGSSATTQPVATVAPTTVAPTTVAPTTPSTVAPTTAAPTTVAPTTVAPTTAAPTTAAPTTAAPTTAPPAPSPSASAP
jgi:hypothetical protein